MLINNVLVLDASLEKEWKSKVDKLEKQIATLENDLAAAKRVTTASVSPNTSKTNSINEEKWSKELQTIKRQLEDEKQAHQTSKRE